MFFGEDFIFVCKVSEDNVKEIVLGKIVIDNGYFDVMC